jgi:hypothetical protein
MRLAGWFVVIIIASCQTNRPVTGVYKNIYPELPNAVRYTITFIRIKADSTFEFESNVGRGWVKTEKYSSGKWTLNNGYLILNSEYQPHDTLEGFVYGLEEYPIKYWFFTNYAFEVNKSKLIDTAEKKNKIIFKRLK